MMAKIIHNIELMPDVEGFIKTVVFWTKIDGTIKMDIADGFSKENLIILLETTLKDLRRKK